MTADPSRYDYFVIDTDVGTFEARMDNRTGSNYVSGGAVKTDGGDMYKIVSTCFGIHSSNAWTCYHNHWLSCAVTASNALYVTNDSFKIYRIIGVTL